MTEPQAASTPRTTLVTGGGSGIGRAIVEALLAGGGHVIAADRDAAALETLREDGSGRLHRIRLDVTDEAAIEAAFDTAEAVHGPVHGVVNSAGIGLVAPAMDTDVEAFRAILNVNLIGCFAVVARAAARRMMPRGSGAIVNITSVSGIRGNVERAAYGSAKGGAEILTRILSTEWAQFGIRVNAVAPGPIETPMSSVSHDHATRTQWLASVPQGRYGMPGEVAAATLFLLDGAQSGYITGQTLCVDGGFVAAGLTARTAA
jgi:NAD(P)-dependent dehydrogenase (short-subunit alcohol dehydrogenase family)